mgnify:CR=1 FL=1
MKQKSQKTWKWNKSSKKHENEKISQKRVENVSWCSFYLLLKVFGLVLLTSGIAAMVVMSLPKKTEVITIITKSENTSITDTNEVKIKIENICRN